MTIDHHNDLFPKTKTDFINSEVNEYSRGSRKLQ